MGSVGTIWAQFGSETAHKVDITEIGKSLEQLYQLGMKIHKHAPALENWNAAVYIESLNVFTLNLYLGGKKRDLVCVISS